MRRCPLWSLCHGLKEGRRYEHRQGRAEPELVARPPGVSRSKRHLPGDSPRLLSRPENGVTPEQIKRTVRKQTNRSVSADDVDQALDDLEERQAIYRADGRYRVLEA